jgi:type I restriction enzyme R subunit
VEKLFAAQLQTLGWEHIAGSLDNPAVTGRTRFAEVIQEGLVRHLEKDWFRLKPD